MKASYVCKMSAEEFWALRMDLGFDQFQADERNGGFKVLENVVVDGRVSRTTVLTFKENPIPPRFRSYLGADEFSFKVRAKWHETMYDEKNRMSYTSEPPVMKDKITVSGEQWVEPISDMQCRVVQTASIGVAIFGLGSSVEDSLIKQTEQSSGQLPQVAEKYLAVLKARKEAEAALAAELLAEDAVATGAASEEVVGAQIKQMLAAEQIDQIEAIRREEAAFDAEDEGDGDVASDLERRMAQALAEDIEEDEEQSAAAGSSDLHSQEHLHSQEQNAAAGAGAGGPARLAPRLDELRKFARAAAAEVPRCVARRAEAKQAVAASKMELTRALSAAETAKLSLDILKKLHRTEEKAAAESTSTIRQSTTEALQAAAQKAASCLLALPLARDAFIKAQAEEEAAVARLAQAIDASAAADDVVSEEEARLVAVAEEAAREAREAEAAARASGEGVAKAAAVAKQATATAAPAAVATLASSSAEDELFARILREKAEAERQVSTSLSERWDVWEAVKSKAGLPPGSPKGVPKGVPPKVGVSGKQGG